MVKEPGAAPDMEQLLSYVDNKGNGDSEEVEDGWCDDVVTEWWGAEVV